MQSPDNCVLKKMSARTTEVKARNYEDVNLQIINFYMRGAA